MGEYRSSMGTPEPISRLFLVVSGCSLGDVYRYLMHASLTRGGPLQSCGAVLLDDVVGLAYSGRNM